MIFDLKAKLKQVQETKLLKEDFDAEFYRAQYSDVRDMTDAKALAHYCTHGWREGRDPNAIFSTTFYLKTYTDVAQAGVNPFWHFVAHGRQEGRLAHRRNQQEVDIAKLVPYFDYAYYRKASPDIASFSDKQLLEHFFFYGWRERRDPSPDFSTKHYLEHSPDVAEAEINPLLHYINSGRSEQRQIGAPMARQWEYLTDQQIEWLEDAFDAKFYRRANPDQQGSDRQLLEHYVRIGWKEGADPNTTFSSDYYLETYPDVRDLCPLVHYVLAGHREGRRTNPDLPTHIYRDPNAVLVANNLSSVLKAEVERPEMTPPVSCNANRLELHWVVPDFAKGSGGHMTIFRMIRHLENFGHRCKVWIESPVFHKTPNDAYESIIKHFQCIQAEVGFVDDGLFETEADAVIATGWSTAYLVNAATGFAGKFYFVQDHEPDFYPTGVENLMARETYNFDLACICASPWLEKIAIEKYGRWAKSFYLAYDPKTYQMDPDAAKNRMVPRRRKKIAVYGRQHTARRCVELALMALYHLGQTRDDFEVHFFGQDDLPFSATNFEAYNHGVQSSEELAGLYNTCDLGICFSGTNYSLVPQEMMACGLPLIELNVDSTQAIFPKGVVTLAGPNPIDIADKIAALLDDPKRCETQSKKATKWVEQFSWEDSARDVEKALKSYLKEIKVLKSPAVKRARDTLLDVVIPTYNGLGEVEGVIAAIDKQRIRDQIQVYCIDSSSPDGTAKWLKKQPNISLTEIDQSDFQHGRTRNQGAAMGKAPLIAFLTQDATPAHQDWATDIVKMMRHYPEAAGVFGRHLPYPDHPLYVRNEIETHFANMLQHPLALSRDTNPTRWASGDVGWRQLLHFYSDNNSAMRRDIWKDIPYAEVDYGEDQVWARDIIEAGHTKLYAPTATVFHSHDYTPEQTYKRCVIEGAFFYEHFGYRLGDATDAELTQRIQNEKDAFQKWAGKHHIDATETKMRKENIEQKYRGWRDGLASVRGTAQTEGA